MNSKESSKVRRLARVVIRANEVFDDAASAFNWLKSPNAALRDNVHLSDVQLLNLSMLMTIQASVEKDPVTTCFKFNLSADEAARIDGLRQEQLQAIVANRGHESLFKLREDFWALLDIPPGLQGTLSRVRLAEIHSTVTDFGSLPRAKSA